MGFNALSENSLVVDQAYDKESANALSGFAIGTERAKTNVIDLGREGGVNDIDADNSPLIQEIVDYCAAEAKEFTVPIGDWGYSGGVDIPKGVVIRGAGMVSDYAGVAKAKSVGSRFVLNASSGYGMKAVGDVLQGFQGGLSGLAFSTHPDYFLDPVVGAAIDVLQLQDVFMLAMTDCSFTRVNAANAVRTIGQCNALTLNNISCTLVGDYPPAFSGLTGQFTYGNGLNLSSAPDSTLSQIFIEGCGMQGLVLPGNSKVDNSFIDLCDQGIYVSGDRASIVNTSVKFHQRNGIFVAPDVDDFTMLGGGVNHCNNGSSVGLSQDTFAIRLTNNKNVDISHVNLSDYNGLSANAGRTLFQNGIHCGAAGVTGKISNIRFGENWQTEAAYDGNNNVGNGLEVDFSLPVVANDYTSSATISSGVTASRPASPQLWQKYRDTTLGYTIEYNGTNWVNGVGATV